VSTLIAAAEEHARVLVSTIAVQTQLLEKEKAKLKIEEELLQAALQGNSSTNMTLDSNLVKVDKRLAADRIERDMLKEAQGELMDAVRSLNGEVKYMLNRAALTIKIKLLLHVSKVVVFASSSSF
jgi:hypothetical protein